MQFSAYFNQQPTFTWVLIVIISLLIGSFLNVVICRLPKMLERKWRIECADIFSNDKLVETGVEEGVYNLCVPRSHCPGCKKTITALQNIPVLSYLFQRGRCANCKTRISLQYPLIELAFMIGSVLMFWHYGFTSAALSACIFTAVLLCLCVIDWQTMMLPDELTIPLLWLGLILNINDTFVPLKSAVIGAVLGYIVLWIIFTLFKLITKKDGMGDGDFKLMAAFGAWMGYQYLPLIVFFAAALTLLGYIIARCYQKDLDHTLPFGPSLTIMGFVMLPWGDAILSQYWRLVS